MIQQTCSNCGAYVRTGARFCGTCGQQIQTSLTTTASAPPVVAPQAAAWLIAVDGQQFSLAHPVTRIGRSSQCALQIPDGSVSAVHAEVEERGSSYVLRDLSSSNGTYVNGNLIVSDTPLNPGDQVTFGRASFTFQSMAAGPAAPPVPAPLPPSAAPWVPENIPLAPAPPAAPDWGRRQPQLEGKVIHMAGPHQEKLSLWAPMATTGCLALLFTGCLAPLAPLAFLPMFSQREITVYHLRVQESQSGMQRAVKIRGDTSTQISQGDEAAFWGKWDGGTLLVKKAYNHHTGAYLKVKGVL
jgi:hypothetical protein